MLFKQGRKMIALLKKLQRRQIIGRFQQPTLGVLHLHLQLGCDQEMMRCKRILLVCTNILNQAQGILQDQHEINLTKIVWNHIAVWSRSHVVTISLLMRRVVEKRIGDCQLMALTHFKQKAAMGAHVWLCTDLPEHIGAHQIRIGIKTLV